MSTTSPDTVPGSAAAPRERAASAPGFIAGPGYDLFFFIGAPLVGLALIGLIVQQQWHRGAVTVGGKEIALAGFFIAAWTNAHLAAVIFRSHLNGEVFRRFRFRMIGVPILLFAALVSSRTAMITAFVVAAFWDLYHTSMQNFGLGRLYDMKRGNDALTARRLDIWANHFAYIGPIFFGANLLPTLEPLARFEKIGWDLPRRFGELILSFQHLLSGVVLMAAAVFFAAYALTYLRLARSGSYRWSWQKLALLGTTAATSIYAWGRLPPFEAFFAINFFHALQYFGIVWWTERRNLRRVFRLQSVAFGSLAALVAYLALLVLMGTAYAAGDLSGLRWAIGLGLVCSLMHFWYDGFIWSVRRKEVTL